MLYQPSRIHFLNPNGIDSLISTNWSAFVAIPCRHSRERERLREGRSPGDSGSSEEEPTEAKSTEDSGYIEKRAERENKVQGPPVLTSLVLNPILTQILNLPTIKLMAQVGVGLQSSSTLKCLLI